MKPIKELRTFGKAKLLFDLFPEETAQFIDYIKSSAKEFIKAPYIINEFQTEDFWKEVAEQILEAFSFCNKKIYRYSGLFADQLFDGYLAVFSTHFLNKYAALPEWRHSKFGKAIDLFF